MKLSEASLRFWTRCRVVVTAVLLLAGVCLGLAQKGWSDEDEEGKGKEKTKSEEKSSDDDEDEDAEGGESPKTSGLGAFGKFLPVGRANEGVTIPSFGGGVRTSLVRAAKMTRVDEEHLEMDEMEIETYTPTGEVETKIAVRRALFHMESSVMTSRSRSRLERPDFEIEGDAMVFDTNTERGRMVGNVEMLIYDVKAFGAQLGEEGAKEGAEGAGGTGTGAGTEGAAEKVEGAEER